MTQQDYDTLIQIEDKDVVVTLAYQKNGHGDYGYHTDGIADYTEEELLDLCDKYEYNVREVEGMVDIIIDVGTDDI